MNAWIIIGIVMIVLGVASLIISQIVFSKKLKSILKE